MGKKLTQEEFIARCNEIHGGKYDYSKSEYVNNRTKVEIICPIHGSFWQLAKNHLSGGGCDYCHSKSTKTKEKFILDAKQIHGNKYDYSKSEYVNNHTKVCVICKEHGEFWIKPNHHLSGVGCPKCAVVNRSKSHKKNGIYYKECAETMRGNKYVYTGKLQGRRMEIICPIHGSFWQFTTNHIQKKHDCPKCAMNGKSKLEEKLLSDLPHFIQSDRTILNGKEIDLINHEKKIGIEINGIYWHNETRKEKLYHLNKTISANDKGYSLLHFWDYEINEKYDIVLSMIKSRMGKSDTRIMARKCVVQVLNTKETNNFLNQNHLQGACNSSVNLALVHENEIVAVMSFGKPRFNNSHAWELIRYCNKLNSNVIGGASKLFSYFLTHYRKNGEKVVSYANRRYSNGDLYNQLGFTLVSESSPNYVWYKDKQIITRYQSQKHKLKSLLPNFDNDKTEYENMTMNGYVRLFDCGNFVYSYQ